MTLHGFDEDGVAVDFYHHHDVSVASLRTCRELASLVGEHGFVYLVRFSVYCLLSCHGVKRCCMFRMGQVFFWWSVRFFVFGLNAL